MPGFSLEDDQDLLDALLANLPEYSWQDQAAAPVPPMVAPAAYIPITSSSSALLLRTSSSASSSAGPSSGAPPLMNRRGSDSGYASAEYPSGSGVGSHSHSQRERRKAGSSSLLARSRADQSALNWRTDTFPFNYALPVSPPLLTPLLVLKMNDPLPRSNVIVSPYLRIPPYTFCVRTSINWRVSNAASLRSRCHLSFLPYFGEEHYDDENEFRDRLNMSKMTRIVFHIPNEDEKDQPKPEPSSAICGICLTVGCIIHHKAEAVPLPAIGGDDEAGPTKSLLPPGNNVSSLASLGSSHGSSASHASSGPSAGGAGPSSRFHPGAVRRRPRDRNQVCGPACIHSLKAPHGAELDGESVEHVPFDQWTEDTQEQFDRVLGALAMVLAGSGSGSGSGGESGSATGSSASSCSVAGFLLGTGRTCIDVEFALRARRAEEALADEAEGEDWSDSSDGGIEFMGTSADADADADAGAVRRQKDRHESKRRKMVHEKKSQKEIQPYYKVRAPEENDEYTQAELDGRFPRTTLPWVPCYHPGRPCTSFTGLEDPHSEEFCACRRNGTWCDPGCGCPVDCTERFSGCSETCPAGAGACKATYEDARGNTVQGCKCVDHMRECHPELCTGHEDPKRCRFMSVQDDRAIRTFVAASDLEGYGLFVGEDCTANRVYVGEYRGELINENEAQERSLLYQTRQRSFLFDLTKLGVVDGMRLGNKTRYINTSRTGKNNCRGDSTIVNGEARLLVHATKDTRSKLQKNDELLLDYGGNYELFGHEA